MVVLPGDGGWSTSWDLVGKEAPSFFAKDIVAIDDEAWVVGGGISFHLTPQGPYELDWVSNVDFTKAYGGPSYIWAVGSLSTSSGMIGVAARRAR